MPPKEASLVPASSPIIDSDVNDSSVTLSPSNMDVVPDSQSNDLPLHVNGVVESDETPDHYVADNEADVSFDDDVTLSSDEEEHEKPEQFGGAPITAEEPVDPEEEYLFGPKDPRSPRIIILPGKSDTAASYEISNEDHTLGNALRFMIMKNPDVEFCGYSIPHPSEPKMNIRIQTYEDSNPVISPNTVLTKGLNDLMELCDMMLEDIDTALDSMYEGFEFEALAKQTAQSSHPARVILRITSEQDVVFLLGGGIQLSFNCIDARTHLSAAEILEFIKDELLQKHLAIL